MTAFQPKICEPDFSGYAVFAESYSFISTFILNQYQLNLMMPFYKNNSKTLFLSHFDHFWGFSFKGDFTQKIRLCYTPSHIFP